MLEERGRIVSIERDGIWVETAQRHGCHGCTAKAGCGTGLLNSYWAKTMKVRVNLNGHNPNNLLIHTPVVIGLGEQALVGSALIIYILPLLMLFAGTILGHLSTGEVGAIIGAAMGLIGGALTIRFFSRRYAAIAEPQLLRVDIAA
ncbi:MAG: SoxR reducing system RseC family protein [Gammaproteobacteria bacterium]|nr:SoxR reducing system RseC family protein [Gammaproteobacteria bacterium]